MTLILSLLTAGYVLQVSDRRLVWPLGRGRYQLSDDDRTKVAIIGRGAMYGYTGLSAIDGMPTHAWFAKTLHPFVNRGQTGNGLLEVRDQLTKRFRRRGVRQLPGRWRRHAFLGVGFKRRLADGQVVALAELITNFHSEDGTTLATAEDEFRMMFRELAPSERLALIQIGSVAADADRLVQMQRYLRRRVFLESPRHAGRVLAHEVRRIADLNGHNGPVGKGLMICCIPRQYALHGGTPRLGPPDGVTLSSMYVPAAGTSHVQMMPAFVIGRFPITLYGITFSVQASDPDLYEEWRHELALPKAPSRPIGKWVQGTSQDVNL